MTMDDFSTPAGQDNTPRTDRLSSLSIPENRMTGLNRRYSAFVKSLRFILPLAAVAMTVIVITWDEGKNIEPMKKEDLIPSSQNIQNELIAPVFNSVDSKEQPFNVSADRAVQNRQNPDLVELDKPVADLTTTNGARIDADAATGLYEQKTQKLNLSGNVRLKHSDGYTLSSEEMRIDLATQKAFSGRDVHVEGPDGTLDATGLEGDANAGTLIFTGPAKIIFQSGADLSKAVSAPSGASSPEATPQGNNP